MSCNIKRIKGCEVAGSTFNGRKLSLNRDFSNDTFKAKVKTFNQKPIAEITGVKNATDVYFPFNGLENLSAGLYIIEYWGNFEDIGNELFCVEEFSVVAPSKAGEAQFCENSNVFNFVTEDVSIDIQITATIVNIGGGDLSNYYTKAETYSKTEVDDIISDIPVVDTSNLVPYTGATQDVNIASNYFKTSKGFDFTKDVNNFLRVGYGHYYNFLEFFSTYISDNNFGYISCVINPDEGFKLEQSYNNGLNLSYFRVNGGEIYSTNPFVSEVGFKTINGSANKVLTSDGGTFDLNTKADLVGGKVPSSQLPSYVDDVLEFANLASFPATGESGKIYIAIDTNLTYRWGGSSYVVMSSSLALGETASTAYRGDRGKTAYDHSQTTGNPHNTKVEELTDVSGETTSITDTDVILKKEVVGGFWRKITWENIKASLKTYFDSLYTTSSAVATQITTALVGYATQSFVNTGLATKQDKFFSHKLTTSTSWVTGTVSETEIYRFSIPANTISSESILSIESMLFNKTGVNGFFQVRVKLTTSATMPTGSTEQIARTPNVSPSTRATAIRKKFYVNGDVMKSQGFDSGIYYDEFNNTDAISSRTLDRTQTYNVIISVTLSNVTDQVRLEGLDFNIK